MKLVPDTTPIFEEDLDDEQFPYDELDEMQTEAEGRCPCRTLPHDDPEGCPR